MAKKKKNNKPKNVEFNNDPFKDLKGFAFTSDAKEDEPAPVVESLPERPESFCSEMEKLGVRKLQQDDDCDEQSAPFLPEEDDFSPATEDPSDEELFLSALGEVSINFRDNVPEETISRQAEPRRMKQLKLGKIVPDASLDLHGFKRADVAAKLSHFLNNAHHRGDLTLLIITGKGLHSEGGEAILRDEVEHFLATLKTGLVAEWGRAPKHYGGNGAVVVFLKKQ